jgi:hypothetical protein
MEEVFHNVRDPLVRYLFLKRCMSAYEENIPLRSAIINDAWIDSALSEIGLKSTYTIRRNILVSMEMPGLTRADGYVHDRQIIAAPVVFWFLRELEEGEVDRLIGVLGEEVIDEAPRWSLSKI